MSLGGRLLWGIILNLAVAGLALRRGGVTRSGAVSGWLAGTVILGFGGWTQWMLLMAFFLSSMLAGRYKRAQKGRAEKMHQRGYQRDAVQVLANTGPALVCIALSWLVDGRFLVLAATAFAAATADTWASDLGILSRRPPVSILTGKVLPPGTSGGVSPLGFGFSLAGSVFIALMYGVAGIAAGPVPELGLHVLIISSGGFLGSVIDSVLGASLQAKYRCAETGELTEKPRTGSSSNHLVGGLALVTNDVVNFMSGAFSTGLMVLAWRFL